MLQFFLEMQALFVLQERTIFLLYYFIVQHNKYKKLLKDAIIRIKYHLYT